MPKVHIRIRLRKYSELVNAVSVNNYLWVDVEGVAHKFTADILSDARNNASSTCQLNLSSTTSVKSMPLKSAPSRFISLK